MGEKHEKWQRFWKKYNDFMEHQGFLIVVGSCVAVIVATAVWTGRRATDTPQAPTPPPSSLQSVSQMLQQSLEDAQAQATPAPTKAPPERVMPLESIVVLRGYNNTVLQRSEVTGIYRMHDAVDLAAAVGEPVKAMEDGTVAQVWEEGVENACVVIEHTDGTTISYAGMSAVAGLQAGDPVQRGQTIGFAGPGPMDESDMEPHLHLRVTKHGASVDPAILLTK